MVTNSNGLMILTCVSYFCSQVDQLTNQRSSIIEHAPTQVWHRFHLGIAAQAIQSELVSDESGISRSRAEKEATHRIFWKLWLASWHLGIKNSWKGILYLGCHAWTNGLATWWCRANWSTVSKHSLRFLKCMDVMSYTCIRGGHVSLLTALLMIARSFKGCSDVNQWDMGNFLGFWHRILLFFFDGHWGHLQPRWRAFLRRFPFCFWFWKVFFAVYHSGGLSTGIMIWSECSEGEVCMFPSMMTWKYLEGVEGWSEETIYTYNQCK